MTKTESIPAENIINAELSKISTWAIKNTSVQRAKIKSYAPDKAKEERKQGN
jgi:hypothetical protein